MRSRKVVAFASLLFTYLFFFEYLPPVRSVHIPFDLRGFHYPLAEYAFQSLRQGRFPLWDPTIYCGLSFVGNIQAALFYPPTWLMFIVNIGRERLSYRQGDDLQPRALLARKIGPGAFGRRVAVIPFGTGD